MGGGVGLAPLRALLYALFNEVNDYKKIVVKYGARTSKDIVYRSEIDSWRQRAPHIDVEISVARFFGWKGNNLLFKVCAR